MKALPNHLTPKLIVFFLAFFLAPCLPAEVLTKAGLLRLALAQDTVTQANNLSVVAFEKAAEAR